MGFIKIFESPYPYESCISERPDWRVEFTGSCAPGHIKMGRHLVVYGGVNRSDGYWQQCSSGVLKATALRTTGENNAIFTWNVPAQTSDPGENKSWFVPGMITYPIFTDEAGGAEKWTSGMDMKMDIPRSIVLWETMWSGSGPKPLIHFFDNGQKFIVASGVPIEDKPSVEFSPGTLILQPKNMSWNPLSIEIHDDWKTTGILSCNELDRVGWMNPSGQFTLHDASISGGICDG